MYDGHRDFLHDSERNILYKDAIERAASQLAHPITAIDIGTGSSLLACMAANAGAVDVVAFEVNPTLARLARRVVEDNRLEDRIQVQHGHSTETTRKPHASLMTHELLDTGLHSEGLLAAVRHAWRELLAPHAISVPQKVALFAQPVHSEFLRAATTLMPSAPLVAPPSVRSCQGAAGYLELHAAPLMAQAHDCVPLAEAACVLELDLMHEPPEGELHPPPTTLTPRDAACDLEPSAVLTWWECTLHPDVPVLSTSPYRPAPHAERDHWQNAFYLLPAGTPPVRPPTDDGRRTMLRVACDDHELWMDLASTAVAVESAPVAAESAPVASTPESAPPRRACTCGIHTMWGPQRLQEVNSINRVHAAEAARLLVATMAAARPSGPPRCVDLGDGPLWSVLVAQAGGRVACVESGWAMRALSSRFVAAAGCSRLVDLAYVPMLAAAGDEACVVQPSERPTERLLESVDGAGNAEDHGEASDGTRGEGSDSGDGDDDDDDDDAATLPPELRGPPFDAVMIEPSFTHLRRCWSGEHLAETVRRRRWAERRALVSAAAPMLPRVAHVFACLLECPELWRRRQRVGDVCGLDLRRFNSLAPPTAETSAHAIGVWQIAHATLSGAVCWSTMHLPLQRQPDGDVVAGGASLVAVRAGTCHAVCCWVNYDYGGELQTRTGPTVEGATVRFDATPWLQGVVLLREPCKLDAGSALEVELHLDLRRGGVLSLRQGSGPGAATSKSGAC